MRYSARQAGALVAHQCVQADRRESTLLQVQHTTNAALARQHVWHPRTCSGGMRQSARKASGVSTGRGGSGASSAARRTASTCGATGGRIGHNGAGLGTAGQDRTQRGRDWAQRGGGSDTAEQDQTRLRS